MGSTRFPGKMLAEIGGEPMVVRTLRRAKAANLPSRVIVATDSVPTPCSETRRLCSDQQLSTVPRPSTTAGPWSYPACHLACYPACLPSCLGSLRGFLCRQERPA
ncbi:hypothetical protein T484DRAFT_1971085, partial [Baffinella frigidus]